MLPYIYLIISIDKFRGFGFLGFWGFGEIDWKQVRLAVDIAHGEVS